MVISVMIGSWERPEPVGRGWVAGQFLYHKAVRVGLGAGRACGCYCRTESAREGSMGGTWLETREKEV